MENLSAFVQERLQAVPVNARKLFDVIVREASHGPLRSKPEGTATPPEILEVCGLDVGEFYSLLHTLENAGLIRVSGAYPFEEIRLAPEPHRFDNFAVPPNQRYFEDYTPGHIYEFGQITATEADIIEFARRFDPQDIHLDAAKAAAGPFGGIVASGWHTISLAMRLYVDHYLSHVASLASPGTEDIRWSKPLRPGDTLRIRVAILDTRPSRSKPEKGIVRARVEAINQNDELLLSMVLISFLGRRSLT